MTLHKVFIELLNRCVRLVLVVLWVGVTLPSYAEDSTPADNAIISDAISNDASSELPQEVRNALADSTASVGSDTTRNSTLDYGKMLGALATVLLLIGGLAWVAKRFSMSPLNSTRNLSIETAIGVGQKEKIAIIVADQQRFLVGISPQGINLLSELGATSTQDQAPSEQASEHVIHQDKGVTSFASNIKEALAVNARAIATRKKHHENTPS